MAKKPKENDWKDRLNVVYSTNPDFKYELDDEEEQTTLQPSLSLPDLSVRKTIWKNWANSLKVNAVWEEAPKTEKSLCKETLSKKYWNY